MSVPGHTKTARLEFLDDSGCSGILLYENDVLKLLDVAPGAVRPTVIPYPLVHGYQITHFADGTQEAIEEVVLNIGLSHQRRTMIPPKRVACSLFSHAQSRGRNGPPRLMGTFFRSMLFTAGAPDNRNRMYVSDNREGLVGMIPEADIAQARHHLIAP